MRRPTIEIDDDASGAVELGPRPHTVPTRRSTPTGGRDIVRSPPVSPRGRRSSGILVYRRTTDGSIEVFLVHPGGPFWHSKDDGAWSIPKGEIEETEDAFSVALREFAEELGRPPPEGEYLGLGEIEQRNGKRVVAWAVLGEIDATILSSNTFDMEWPPGTGRVQSFPEVDRGGWFSAVLARRKLNRGQDEFVDRLLAALDRQREEEARAD